MSETVIVSGARTPIGRFLGAFADDQVHVVGDLDVESLLHGHDQLHQVQGIRTQVIDERRLHSRAGYDPFHGRTVSGVPVLSLSRGEVVARDAYVAVPELPLQQRVVRAQLQPRAHESEDLR